ncbi:hypothetical protein NIES267_46380 [Calothrix parasitica NIES-267]|uniref:Uncharacterized protein n=1 Tax=Calothrix parasitica NIES-267 TaxID=1973488 RepID=A0A1Z4LV76_9CYAN|nr:hypothetical protein NIES267_46380 [Calothrix parasitica NIES-267]
MPNSQFPIINKDLFAIEALAQIPKILTLLDRNPHSPTYGCFDRNFWHYKIIDFPSGMAQEFVFPLALIYDSDIPNNPYYRQSTIKDWVKAGISYAARSAHKDGSCDDYFPFERASGAAAFSLLACIESYIILNLEDDFSNHLENNRENNQFDNQAILNFFTKRANWLAEHHESGRLTNHQALIVLCLERLSQLLNTSQWDKAKVQRLERVLSWQNDEGWFIEYEGCDPGYHTLTISCLARIYQFNPDIRIKEALIKAVNLAAEFVHPDGSYGGEYTSRNTYNFFPHGFELVGKWMPEALQINYRFLQGLASGLSPCYADDHIIGHHTWNYLLAWRDFVDERPSIDSFPDNQNNRIWLQNAKILIDRRQNTQLYLALNKGGVFKLFRDNKLVIADTQISLQVSDKGKIKNAVGHLVSPYRINIEDDEITISGNLGWAKQKQMTPLNLLILRFVMLTVGRFFPDLIRKLLQRVLIVGKNDAPFWFTRRFFWKNGKWCVVDKLEAKTWDKVISAGIGCDQTSIYVVMSRTFQKSQLQPWLDLTAEVKKLASAQPLKIEREL